MQRIDVNGLYISLIYSLFFFFVIISLLQILNIFKEENLLVGIRSNAFETFPSMSMTILWIELSTEKFICVCSLKLYFSAIFIW